MCVKFGFQRVKLKSYSIIMKKKMKNERKKNFIKLNRLWLLSGLGDLSESIKKEKL